VSGVLEGVDAVIFDLDGVVTRTARVHAQAWKDTFDPLLAARGERAFDSADYLRHVDGKPRLDGVRDFLASRGLAAAEDEVRALGERKNARFLALLAAGVEVYPSTLDWIRALRERGVRTAVVSASRNAAAVLRAAGLEALFDARVDGNDAARLGLAGKPAPDTYLRAAEALGVPPARAAVVEDALAGVAAGRAGGFAAVIGVDRAGQAEALRTYGATRVVRDLAEIMSPEMPAPLPSAFARLPELATRRLALFLDYDGTLTPIVERPEDAVLAPEMREVLQRVARRHAVAVVSGRDLADVRARVGLEALTYAGSHGFDIAGPSGRHVHEAARAAATPLAAAAGDLERDTAGLPGVQVERKRFALAVHFRRARAADVPAVEAAVDRARARHAGLRKTGGKMIFELRPDVDWDKGRAVLWLIEALGLREAFPVYLGDDLTDEDAFRALAGRGLGVVVQETPQASAASLALRDPVEVRTFLEGLA